MILPVNIFINPAIIFIKVTKIIIDLEKIINHLAFIFLHPEKIFIALTIIFITLEKIFLPLTKLFIHPEQLFFCCKSYIFWCFLNFIGSVLILSLNNHNSYSFTPIYNACCDAPKIDEWSAKRYEKSIHVANVARSSPSSLVSL